MQSYPLIPHPIPTPLSQTPARLSAASSLPLCLSAVATSQLSAMACTASSFLENVFASAVLELRSPPSPVSRPSRNSRPSRASHPMSPPVGFLSFLSLWSSRRLFLLLFLSIQQPPPQLEPPFCPLNTGAHFEATRETPRPFLSAISAKEDRAALSHFILLYLEKPEKFRPFSAKTPLVSGAFSTFVIILPLFPFFTYHAQTPPYLFASNWIFSKNKNFQMN